MVRELDRCLESLSDRVLRQIGTHHGLQSANRQELGGILTKPAHLRRCWSRFSKEERTVWIRFLLEAPQGVVKESTRLKKQLPAGLTPSRFRLTLTRLRQQGWIYAARDRNRERFYLCPIEIRRAWIKAFLNQKMLSPQPVDEDIIASSPPVMGIGQALFYFLTSVEREPWRLTRTGQIHKRQAQKLDVDLDLDPEALSGTNWKRKNGAPPWVELLVEFACQLDLVRIAGGELIPDRQRIQEWIHLSMEEMNLILYEVTRHQLTRQLEGGEGYWLIMENLSYDTWYSLKDLVLARNMITGRKEVLLANELNKCASLIVKPLQALGWLEIGQIPTGECFRLTGFPPRSGTGDELPVYVQPDLEVLVPFTFPYTKRYQLAKFADFMGGDQYLHYEINEGSIRRACQLGQSLPEIIHLLVEWSCFPLPEIVQQQIENWAGQFQGVLLEPVVLVHTRDESLADKLQDTALGQSWKVDRRGPSCLSVSPSSLGQVKEWLKKEGKQVSAIREPLVKEGDKDLSGPEYWSQRLHVLHKAELDNHYPEMTEAWPGAKNIPKLWTSGLRSYHPSMQQELLRRSIEEQLDVRLEWKGQFLTVTPHQLKREGGECFLEGWGPEGRKRRLSLNEITRLQIFIPQPEPGHH